MQKTIYQKILALRESVTQLDWSTDKSYVLNGSKIDYVTITKMRRNISPLFAAAGLDFDFNIIEVVDHGDFIRIKVEFILIDTDTEDMSVTTLYSDGMTTNTKGYRNDKAIEIALSYAMRMYVTTKFCIADGIELDTEGEQTESDFQENVRKTLEKAAIPEEETARPKVEKIEVRPIVPKTDTDPPAGHRSVVKPKTDSPAETKGGKSAISPMEAAAAAKAIKFIEQAYADGIIVEDVYTKAKSLYEGLTGSADVLDLLSLKKEAEELKMSRKDVGM